MSVGNRSIATPAIIDTNHLQDESRIWTIVMFVMGASTCRVFRFAHKAPGSLHENAPFVGRYSHKAAHLKFAREPMPVVHVIRYDRSMVQYGAVL
jgi:hypothetical protein